MYTPHVLAMDVNQKFQVKTSDQTTHNIHPLPDATTGNIPWNKSQPPGAPPIEAAWKAEEVAIPVKCNIHPWMHGYFVVVKGPYAMTDGSGNFTIKGLPPGNYTVTFMARNARHANTEGHCCRGQTSLGELYLHSEVTHG